MVSSVGQGSAVLVMSPDGSVERRVPSDIASEFSTPQWSPDGSAIYMAQPAVRGLAPRIVQVPWLDPVTGRTLFILTGWEDVHALSLSPDGKSLAFITVGRSGAGQPDAELNIVSLPDRVIRYRKRLPGYDPDTAPMPSKIAWMQEGQVVIAIPQGIFSRYKARLVRFIPAEDAAHDLAYLEDTLYDWTLSGAWLVYSTESGLWGVPVNGRRDPRPTPIRLSPTAATEVLLATE
jgi:hypothetical protein